MTPQSHYWGLVWLCDGLRCIKRYETEREARDAYREARPRKQEQGDGDE